MYIHIDVLRQFYLSFDILIFRCTYLSAIFTYIYMYVNIYIYVHLYIKKMYM